MSLIYATSLRHDFILRHQSSSWFYYQFRVSGWELQILLTLVQSSPIWPTLGQRKMRGPLFFIQRSGKPPGRQFFVKYLKKSVTILGVEESEFNTLSFRIGRATDLAEAGASYDVTKRTGRLKSDAYLKYIRIHTFTLLKPMWFLRFWVPVSFGDEHFVFRWGLCQPQNVPVTGRSNPGCNEVPTLRILLNLRHLSIYIFSVIALRLFVKELNVLYDFASLLFIKA